MEMVLHIFGKEYCSPNVPQNDSAPSGRFYIFLEKLINSGVPRASMPVVINNYLRMSSAQEITGEETSSLSEGGCCKAYRNVSDEVWDELLACYDMDHLDIQEKKKLADDLMKKGAISQAERDRFINMLNGEEEKDVSPPCDPEVSILDNTYSNPTGVLDGPIHVTTLGSGMTEAEIDNILARHDFDHLLGQMKVYAYHNR